MRQKKIKKKLERMRQKTPVFIIKTTYAEATIATKRQLYQDN